MKINSSNIKFRKAVLNDVDVFIEYRIIFLNEIHKPISSDKEIILRKKLKDYFNRTVKNGTFISWIAEYEKKPVGIGSMVLREQPGHFKILNGKVGHILNMYTIPEFRKNGICSEILKRLIKEGEKLNLSKIDLLATEQGESLYRKFGFKEPTDKALELCLNK
jgi:N-acetylglutamate synthase-like GNAT family acetyltransferase